MNPATVGNTLRGRSPRPPRKILQFEQDEEEQLDRDDKAFLPEPASRPQGQRRRHHTGNQGEAGDPSSQLRPLNSGGIINEEQQDPLSHQNGFLGSTSTPVQDSGDRPPRETQEMTRVQNDELETLRKNLAFFFMDPVQKFTARRQIPWKLVLQIIKIIIVTTQVGIFGNYRFAHTKYYADNQISLEHLFLKNWDSVREIHGYPPATGVFAIYEKSSFYQYFDFIANTFYHLEDKSINPVFKNSSFDFCIERMNTNGRVYPNLTWDIDFSNLQKNFSCISIPTEDLKEFDSRQELKKLDFDVPWSILTFIQVNFTLSTITYTKLGPLFGPECFTFNTVIKFDNSDFDGQIPITLNLYPSRMSCATPKDLTSGPFSYATTLLDYLVITLCVLSFILCLRALIRAQMLRATAERILKAELNWDLSHSEKLDFLNVWYIIILINDVLIITGSIIKEMIESRSIYGDLWDFCSIFLGTGTLLVWIGMLRYLGFFKSYNVLILTIKGALPNVLRFLLCASFIYLGFTFCGWLILGPYNFKFKTILSTSECLFSLINGDDMFATFSSVPESSMTIWVYSKIYLYIFISIFIYVILSLFIAIIMDTYEIIKEYYKSGFPKARLHEFYKEAKYDPTSGIFRIPNARFRPGFLFQALGFLRCNRLYQRNNNEDSTPII